MKDAIVFDLDGTLWDTVSAVVRSWNEVLDRRPEARAHLTEEAMRAYMGKTTEQIAALMLPALPLPEALPLMAECTQSEYAYLRAHGGGRLFDGLRPALEALCAPYDLFIVSNCDSGYIEIFLEVHDMARCFRGHACPGDTGLDRPATSARCWRRRGIRAPSTSATRTATSAPRAWPASPSSTRPTDLAVRSARTPCSSAFRTCRRSRQSCFPPRSSDKPAPLCAG